MSNVMFTSNEAEADVVNDIEQNYAEHSGAIAAKTEALIAAVARGDESWESARDDLSTWAATSVTSALNAESAHVLAAAKQLTETRPLAEAIDAETNILTSLLRDVAGAEDGVRAAASARATRSVFDLHAENMTARLVPLLAGESSVSLADLWAQVTSDSSNEAHDPDPLSSAPADDHAHSCTCGESDGPEHPELDVRTVPHAIRHATVFGALDSVSPGDGMVLVAPHDPLPLLAQIDQRYSGGFSVEYLQRGPEAWRLDFVRA
ncbi:DUF2249 domain-containing protein [Brevibacterium sp. FME37]|uniref:DUF2249 domain-containing protein n=1 Tax=Brevibacterium sp. FME37 TaxID=2742607 RepID=UPI0018664239|nr:DUF2249 domain-containing protein [Brevibacterium sp. FME37]